MKARAPKSEQHRWGDRVEVDLHHTHRACARCGIVRVTRHEAFERPWVEFKRDGIIVSRAGQPTPRCDARIEKVVQASNQGAAA